MDKNFSGYEFLKMKWSDNFKFGFIWSFISAVLNIAVIRLLISSDVPEVYCLQIFIGFVTYVLFWIMWIGVCWIKYEH